MLRGENGKRPLLLKGGEAAESCESRIPSYAYNGIDRSERRGRLHPNRIHHHTATSVVNDTKSAQQGNSESILLVHFDVNLAGNLQQVLNRVFPPTLGHWCGGLSPGDFQRLCSGSHRLEAATRFLCCFAPACPSQVTLWRQCRDPADEPPRM